MWNATRARSLKYSDSLNAYDDQKTGLSEPLEAYLHPHVIVDGVTLQVDVCWGWAHPKYSVYTFCLFLFD